MDVYASITFNDNRTYIVYVTILQFISTKKPNTYVWADDMVKVVGLVFNLCVLHDINGTATWSLNTGLMHKLEVPQRATERAMLRVSFRDKIQNLEIQKELRSLT